jgi:4Fe-4S ferredoxin
MKLLKTERENELTVKRLLHAKSYSLTLDKTRCPGCGICVKVCPREAIELKKSPKAEGEKAKQPTINIDEQKCSYCGICEALCPFGALEHLVDDKPWVAVVEFESFPRLIRDIRVDTEKCKVGCIDCEGVCPLGLIKVNVQTPGGEKVTDFESRTDKEGLMVTVDLDKEHCPCCRLCEIKCPHDAFTVQKTFNGNLKINQQKCPQGCQDCLDVCPISGALYLEDGKVHVNEMYCIYCGVCANICPEEGALELQRTHIRHTPVHSGAWNKALEKLSSTKEMSKELQTKSLKRTRESVERRLARRRSK